MKRSKQQMAYPRCQCARGMSDTWPNTFCMAVAQALLCADNENKVTKFDLRSENEDSDTAAEVCHLS